MQYIPPLEKLSKQRNGDPSGNGRFQLLADPHFSGGAAPFDGGASRGPLVHGWRRGRVDHRGPGVGGRARQQVLSTELFKGSPEGEWSLVAPVSEWGRLVCLSFAGSPGVNARTAIESAVQHLRAIAPWEGLE